MSDMRLQKVSVSEAASGVWHVEIELADNDDIAAAQESISARLRIGPFPSDLMVGELKLVD